MQHESLSSALPSQARVDDTLGEPAGEPPEERLRRVVEEGGADRGALWRSAADGRLHVVVAAGYPAELVASWPPLDTHAQLPPSVAARTRRPLTVGTKKELERKFPEVVRRPTSGPHALACTPVIGPDGAVAGVLGLSYGESRSFDVGEIRRLLGLGQALADLVTDAPAPPATEPINTSEGRYRAVVAGLAEAVWIADARGRAIEGGEAWQRLTGHPADRFLGDGWLEAVHPQDRPRARQAWVDAVAEQRELDVALRVGVRQMRRTVRLRGLPVPGAGQMAEWVVVCSDVTDVERRELARDGLLRLAGALAPALTLHEIAATVAGVLPGYLGAYSASLAVLDEEGTTLRFLQANRAFSEETARPWRALDVQADAPVAEAARTGRIVLNRSREEFVAGRPHLQEAARSSGVHAWASLPLLADGRVLGVLGLTWLEEQELGPADRAHLSAVADACAQAVRRARLHERELGVSVALQHTLLPQLPDVPGAQLAARYLPCAEDGDAGGDWYDVWHTPTGRVAVVLGDVMGHGATPAALIGQLRAATRAFASQSESPLHVATSLDRYFDGFQVSEALVTMVYAVVDVEARSLEIVNLGHLPPLLHSDGRVTPLAVPTGLPLGFLDAPDRTATRVALPDDATLLLCSDGLVETHGRPVGHGLEELKPVLARAAERYAGDAAAVTEEVVRDMLADRTVDDDVVLLVLTLAGSGTRPRDGYLAELSLAPERSSPPQARRWAAEVLRRWQLEHLEDDVALAVGELVGNAVVHGRSPVDVTLLRLRDRLRVEVTDRFGGRPVVVQPGDEAQGGRGLLIVREVADAWGFDWTGAGKRVWAELLIDSTPSS